MSSTRGTRGAGDRGDIVLGWLLRLAVGLGLVGVLAFDGISLVTARFQTADAAASAARAAADAYHSSHSVQGAYDAAYAQVASADETVGTRDFRIGPDGSVTLTVTRIAHTLVLHTLGPLRGWARVTATGSGAPPP